jgi:hypothetical protein
LTYVYMYCFLWRPGRRASSIWNLNLSINLSTSWWKSFVTSESLVAHTRLFVGRVSPLGGLLLEPLAALW